MCMAFYPIIWFLFVCFWLYLFLVPPHNKYYAFGLATRTHTHTRTSLTSSRIKQQWCNKHDCVVSMEISFVCRIICHCCCPVHFAQLEFHQKFISMIFLLPTSQERFLPPFLITSNHRRVTYTCTQYDQYFYSCSCCLEWETCTHLCIHKILLFSHGNISAQFHSTR